MPLKLLLLFLTISTTSAQTRQMAFLGAGGEPPGPETIFDIEAKKIGEFSRRAKSWKIDLSFNGGHSTTESILKNGVEKNGPTNRPFTKDSFEQIITSYENKLKNGELKEGDQLLLYISSHGAQNSFREDSHQIAVKGGALQNYQTLQGTTTVSLDRLKSLVALAQEKKVKLGILDFSCHSGSSLNLALPNTCVITSTGPKHFAWAGNPYTFGARFSSLMEPGKNLEQIYLEAFSDRYDTSFPMISTPQGTEIQNELYKLLTPYLYDWSPEEFTNKLSPYLEKVVLENQCLDSQVKFHQIIELSKDMEKVVSQGDKKEDFSKFRQALTNYHEFQIKMRNDLVAMDLPLLKKQERFCETAVIQVGKATSRQQRCKQWSISELLSMDFISYMAVLAEQAKSKDIFDKAFALAEIEAAKKAMIRQQELLAENKNLLKYKDYYNSIPGLQRKTDQMATAVSLEFQKLYQKLYRKSHVKDAPNACRDFVL